MKNYTKPNSKSGTMYSETERHLTAYQLDKYNLNFIAFWGMMESYIEKIHPLPVKWVWAPNIPKDLKSKSVADSQEIELYIYAVGNVSTKFWGSPEKLDQTFTRLFMQSYWKGLRPLPVSFQIMDAVEIHLRTPGVMDSDLKNPTRHIFNPLSKDGK